MPDQDARNSANVGSLNTLSYRPPSLILSPSRNDSSPDSTPSTLDSQWRLNGVNQLGLTQQNPPARKRYSAGEPQEETSPKDSSSTTSSASHADETTRVSNATGLHSRGSSTTSTTSISQNLETPSMAASGLNSPLSPDGMSGSVSARRPVSFSGGIPQADMGRLQNLYTKGQPPSPISTLNRLDGPRTSPPRENLMDVWGDGKAPGAASTPPRFPSLGDQPTTAFPSIHAGGASGADMTSPTVGNHSPMMSRNEYLGLSDPLDQQQRGHYGSYAASRQPESQYRPPPRTTVPASYAPQPVQAMLTSSSGYMYPSQQRPPPLDRAQAAFAAQQPYYDLVNSPPPMRRDSNLLAQRGAPLPASPMPMFSSGQPGTTAESVMRSPAPVHMLNGSNTMSPYLGMGMPASGLFTPPPNSSSPIHPSFPAFAANGGQYYPQAQGSPFNNSDVLASAMGRMAISPSFPTATQSQYNSEGDGNSDTQTGPSANNRKLGLYKTELCRSWEEKGTCRYGTKCQFAHSEGELRRVSRHPKYKTEICRTFWVSGSCPYGKRCCFIHTELPASGTPPGADGSSPPKLTTAMSSERLTTSNGGNRDRSTSNSSGGDPPPVSLLQRISAQRDSSGVLSPGDTMSPGGAYHFGKPSAGPLRLDTTSLPGKTNYPLTSNPALVSSDHGATGMSPVLPATAGPDFGRQTAARAEVVGYNGSVGNAQRGLVGVKGSNGRDSQLRHSFNGTEMGLSINSPVLSSNMSPSMTLTPISPDSANAQTPTGTTGHQRAGSAGQWPTGSLNSRNNSSTHLASPSSFIRNHASPAEISSPWGPPEMPSNRKRLSGTWL